MVAVNRCVGMEGCGGMRIPWRKRSKIVRRGLAIACKIDLRPGGDFSSTMLSPEGREFPNSGCVLEVVPNRKLVFTDTLLAGYRP